MEGRCPRGASPFRTSKKGGAILNDSEFVSILNQLSEYLKANKTFVKNPFRVTEIERADTIADELFPDAKREITDDPLQMGAIILYIEDFDIDVGGEREINLFSELIKIADVWEIYPKDNGNVCLAAVFHNAFVRI
jgi:hypothetical protein